MTGVSWPYWQAGTELSTQVETLQAEKEQLRRSVSEKERELLSTRSLVQEKELQLSQEADKASREICELQGKLLEKVRGCAPRSVLGRVLSTWGLSQAGARQM